MVRFHLKRFLKNFSHFCVFNRFAREISSARGKQIKRDGPFSLLFFQLKREKELEEKIAALEAKCEGKLCVS